MTKELKAGDKVAETFEPTIEWGHQSFEVKPGTHTVIVDTKFMQQKAIAEFLREVRKRGGSGPRGQLGVREAVAVALGMFDIPMKLIFEENEGLVTEFDLDDHTLAQIVRMRNERKTNDDAH